VEFSVYPTVELRTLKAFARPDDLLFQTWRQATTELRDTIAGKVEECSYRDRVAIMVRQDFHGLPADAPSRPIYREYDEWDEDGNWFPQGIGPVIGYTEASYGWSLYTIAAIYSLPDEGVPAPGVNDWQVFDRLPVVLTNEPMARATASRIDQAGRLAQAISWE